jgi:hypothetical protein
MDQSSDGSFQCCFCGMTVTTKPPDPVPITIPLEDGGTQHLFAHLQCLQDVLHPSVPLGIFEIPEDA